MPYRMAFETLHLIVTPSGSGDGGQACPSPRNRRGVAVLPPPVPKADLGYPHILQTEPVGYPQPASYAKDSRRSTPRGLGITNVATIRGCIPLSSRLRCLVSVGCHLRLFTLLPLGKKTPSDAGPGHTSNGGRFGIRIPPWQVPLRATRSEMRPGFSWPLG